MHFLLKKTFENRNMSKKFLQDIENGHYENLLNIDDLARRLHQIKIENKHITVIPDFDSDGINSGIIGYAGLAELGFHVSLFIPNPKEGYEITPETIDRLLSEHPNTDAILTCDVGITCFKGIDHAKSKGLTVLVTDHHNEKDQPAGLQMADCIVDPMCKADNYAHPRICGAFVLYQCLQYYADNYSIPFYQDQIRRLRVFAGIGTVSDVMPVLYENRKLIRDAISISKMIYFGGDDYIVKNLQGCEIYRRAFYGLHILIKTFAEKGKLKDGNINEEFFGYYLAPALNSTKRMDEDMRLAFGIFFGPDYEENALKIVELNEERKELEKNFSITSSEEKDMQPYAPYIYFSDAPSGILGLLAMEVCNETGLPCVVVRKEENGRIHGSGRSPKWYPFFTRSVPHGFSTAGHNPAFGISFTDGEEMKRLHAFLEKDVTTIYENGVKNGEIETEPIYDFIIAQDGSGDVAIDVVAFEEYLEELQHHRPFGEGFAAPNILLKYDMTTIDREKDIKVIGSENQHLKIGIDYGMEILLWNQSSELDRIKNSEYLSFSGHLEESMMFGKQRINFVGTVL